MKRVLFDENMPRKLRRDLSEFAIRTVQEQGWSGLKNGALLGRAAGAIDVLVTIDQNIRHQQNVAHCLSVSSSSRFRTRGWCISARLSPPFVTRS